MYLSNEDINTAITNLSSEDKEWLIEFGTSPVLRILMNSSHIKKANKLLKLGLMEKGHSHTGLVQYYVDSHIHSKL